MSWRTHPGYAEKTALLHPAFRGPFETFLDNLDKVGIPFALGDTVRSLDREWEVWKIGRHCPVGGDPADPQAWAIYAPKLVVTRVCPGSGRGPHPFGLAGDVYPLNGAALMSDMYPKWKDTIGRMWALAEACGLDALGHDDPTKRDDALWSGDPCHYQALHWRSLLPPVTKDV